MRRSRVGAEKPEHLWRDKNRAGVYLCWLFNYSASGDGVCPARREREKASRDGHNSSLLTSFWYFDITSSQSLHKLLSLSLSERKWQ